MRIRAHPTLDYLTVRDALLKSLHYTFLYRQLTLTSKERGGLTITVGKAIHNCLLSKAQPS